MSEVGYGPLQRIDGPPPVAPRYGLLQAARSAMAGVRIVLEEDERWINGVEVYPYPPGCADVFDPCAPGTIQEPMGDGEAVAHPQFGAMTVWFAETCTAMSVPDDAAFKARAAAALAAIEGAAVAKELLTGERLPLNPHLSDGEGVFPISNTATSPQNGLALLEAEIARSCRQGLIHVSPQIATFLRDKWAIDEANGVLRTANGIPVINDFGYVDGADPDLMDAAGAGQEWIYATGPIDIRRSEIFMLPETRAEALDRGMGATNDVANSITYRAERYYVVDWDTHLQAAVLVDRCVEEC